MPSWPVASAAAAATTVLAVISMATAVVRLDVTLAAPPPIVMVEERRETGLPASPGGETHGLPSWSELEASGDDVARPKVEHSSAGHEVEVVETPCSGEAGARVELPAIPPSRE